MSDCHFGNVSDNPCSGSTKYRAQVPWLSYCHRRENSAWTSKWAWPTANLHQTIDILKIFSSSRNPEHSGCPEAQAASMCWNHVPICLNCNRVYIKDQRDLSLPPGIYQIYTPVGIFDVRLKQNINLKKKNIYIYIYSFIYLFIYITLLLNSKGIYHDINVI